jgi:hypothetical protein
MLRRVNFQFNVSNGFIVSPDVLMPDEWSPTWINQPNLGQYSSNLSGSTGSNWFA